MRPASAVAEVRAVEDRLRAELPPGTLMQRAVAGLAAAVLTRLPAVYGTRVVVLAGGGDNGADALWTGARLARRGARVDAVLLGEGAADARAALHSAGGRSFPGTSEAAAAALGSADVVLDGMVGIGGKGALRDDAAALARRTADSGAFVVAVDLPSGVDADTGAIAGEAVRADLTVTFGTLKPGLLVVPGRTWAGEVELVDIGLGPQLPPADEPGRIAALDDADVAALLPRLPADTDKYRRGVVGVVAGGPDYTGAAVLSVAGALAAGVGMVRYAGPAHAADRVRAAWPEAVVSDVGPGDAEAVLAAGRVQAWVLGPGVGTGDEARDVLAALLDTDVPVLVDADGLTVLGREPGLLDGRGTETLLTPHEGEFARLTGADRRAVTEDRIGATRAAAADLGATVLLKGSTTVVADPRGTVRVTTTGTPALATAGSGDVLSGAAGALLAGGLRALDAGAAAAHLHGLAGREAPEPVSSSALPRAWPAAVARVRAAGR
jgi:ADP-dependent NAD(P)H-hydrate dehydratase / NAD(P)H-hydrate epimerase